MKLVRNSSRKVKRNEKNQEEKAVARQTVVWWVKGKVSEVSNEGHDSDDGKERTGNVDGKCNATPCIIEEAIPES